MSDIFFDQEEPETDYEVVEEPRRRGRTVLLVLLVLLVLGAVAAGAAALWVQQQVNPSGGPGEEVAFVVPQGSSTAAIGEMLEAEGVITDAQIWRYYLRVRGGGPFQAGEYTLQRNMGMGDVVERLSAGPQIVYDRVTVPEGLTLEEVAERIDRIERLSGERFLELAESGEIRSAYQPDGQASLEGLLFPETYTFDEREDEEALLRRMVASMEETARELGYDDAEARVGLTPYETFIVASLVEMEAFTDADRDKIARVIYNRVEEGMRLDIDATVYYALGRRGGSLTRSDLDVDSPYNTRKFAGIPPTPIAMPGRASLEAAMNPAEGDWLFYVRTEESGEHSFSRSYDEFLRNREVCRQRGFC